MVDEATPVESGTTAPVEESKFPKFDVGFQDNKLRLGLDLNQDGEKLMLLDLNINEAIQEAFKRGESVVLEGAKVVGFEFGMNEKMRPTLKLKIDSDKDGESVMDLMLDLGEAMDESGLMK